ncbi:uncharacterized [Tachysurus ichikawai]
MMDSLAQMELKVHRVFVDFLERRGQVDLRASRAHRGPMEQTDKSALREVQDNRDHLVIWVFQAKRDQKENQVFQVYKVLLVFLALKGIREIWENMVQKAPRVKEEAREHLVCLGRRANLDSVEEKEREVLQEILGIEALMGRKETLDI